MKTVDKKTIDEIYERQKSQNKGKNITTIGLDENHSKALDEIREDKEAIEAARAAGILNQLTQTEKDDIAKLDARRNKSAGTTKFEKKLSGEDTVILKELEQIKAATKFDSSKIQNTAAKPTPTQHSVKLVEGKQTTQKKTLDELIEENRKAVAAKKAATK